MKSAREPDSAGVLVTLCNQAVKVNGQRNLKVKSDVSHTVPRSAAVNIEWKVVVNHNTDMTRSVLTIVDESCFLC